jgi:oligosaccharide repeat unit polymerase
MHILTTIPMLIIGSRGDFVLSALFLVLYYFLRNHLDGKGSWIGRLEKGVFAVGLPLGIIAMGMMAYLRSNLQMASTSPLDVIVSSIYSQGVSYEVLGRGYNFEGYIGKLGFRGYSFGSVTDYILSGPFGRFFLGNEALPEINSIRTAVEGHSFSHALSYHAHYAYLEGQGWGSSYLLELNQDFGMLGVAVFSLLFGALLGSFPWLLTRGWLSGTIVLAMCTIIFHMPRGAAAEWAFFLITPQFWFTILLMVGGAALLRAKRFQGFALWRKRQLSDGPTRRTTGDFYEHGYTWGSAGNDTAQMVAHPGCRRPLRWIGSDPLAL